MENTNQNNDLELPLLQPEPEFHVDDLRDGKMFFPFYREEVAEGDFRQVKKIVKYILVFWVCLLAVTIIQFNLHIDYKVSNIKFITDQYWAIVCQATYFPFMIHEIFAFA